MKIPLITSFLILTISATLGWRQWETLRHLGETEHALATHAMNQATGNHSSAGQRPPRVRKSMAERETEARSAAKKWISSLIEQETQRPGEAYRDMEERIARMLEPFYRMNGLQLRAMIKELREFADPAPGHFWYAQAISDAITALAATDPHLAMTFLSENDSRFGDIIYCSYDRVIGVWASTDPLGALAWMRENQSKVQGEGRRSLLSGLAGRDPELAFHILVEFEMYDLHGDGEYEGRPNFSAARIVARTARTLEDRGAMVGILRTIRDSAGDDPDNIKGQIVDNALYAMADGIANYGYERASAWLDSLNLRPDEVTHFMQGMRITEIFLKDDIGKWFEWMGKRLSSEDFDSATATEIWTWVHEDPRSVENWLAQTADGPAKQAVMSTYDSLIASQQAVPEQHNDDN
jgi:hypothetical protein